MFVVASRWLVTFLSVLVCSMISPGVGDSTEGPCHRFGFGVSDVDGVAFSFDGDGRQASGHLTRTVDSGQGWLCVSA